jgi:DSF synthase
MLHDVSYDLTSGAIDCAEVLDGVLAPAMPDRFWGDLKQIEAAYDISQSTVWTFMQFDGRPSFNPDLLVDFHGWGRHIRSLKAEMGEAFKYVVLGSRHPGVYCLGGDLDAFSTYIRNGDREALLAYGRSCIQILHDNWSVSNAGVISIGLAQGDALGGGFESLLSFDILCAERGARFGFPEQLFGLFPGMGALTFLGRKLGFAKAEQLVRTGALLSAEQLYEMGVVHILAEPGMGVSAVNKYIHRHGARHAAELCMLKASKRANPIPFEELDDIVQLWVDACMTLGKHDLAVMQRLVSAQTKLEAAAA